MKLVLKRKSYHMVMYRIICTYTLLTLLLAFCGPIKFGFDILPAIKVALYIAVFLLITFCGMTRESAIYNKPIYSPINRKYIIKVIQMTLFIVFPIKLLLLLSSIKIYGMPQLNGLFRTMANVYTELHTSAYVENIFRQIDSFTKFVSYFAIFGGYFCRKELNRGSKLLLLMDFFLEVIYSLLFIATMRSLLTYVVLYMSTNLISSFSSQRKHDKKEIRKIVLICIILAILFMNIVSARFSLWNSNNSYIYDSNYDFSNIFLFWCSNDNLKFGVCSALSYFTQGYYGLSLAFQVPFKWTFFLGNARGINSMVSALFPSVPDLITETYPVRAGALFGYDGLAHWYTIFSWLASDFTFFGALIIMYLVARLYAKTIIDSVEGKNPLAFSVFVLLNIGYIFLVANNQLFIQRGEALATIVLVISYLCFGSRLNYYE